MRALLSAGSQEIRSEDIGTPANPRLPYFREDRSDTWARIQVPTLRNADKRPDPVFVKAYGHNGYLPA
jgi:cytochrome c peroxidase